MEEVALGVRARCELTGLRVPPNRKPWENAKAREALMNVSKRLLYPLVGDALDSKFREVELG